MILWLASYPRSGNTYLRTILNTCFGVNTYSIYNDESDIGKTNSFSETVGHKSYTGSWKAFYNKARDADELYAIKTHDKPIDDSKAIYVVRDARAAVVSFYHYLLQYSRYKADLYDVISGAVSYGGWSQHYRDWSPESRPDTLLLKFEELTSNTDIAIEKIAEFTRQPLSGGKPPSFEELHSKFPAFFRKGSNEDNTAELSPDHIAYLNFIHGETIKALGYSENTDFSADAVRTAIDFQAEKLRQFRLGQLGQIASTLQNVKQITEEFSAASIPDRKLLKDAEFSARQATKLLKTQSEILEKQTEQLKIHSDMLKKQTEQSKIQSDILKKQISEKEKHIEASRNEIQKLKGENSALKIDNDVMKRVLEPSFRSFLEMRALRYALKSRRLRKNSQAVKKEAASQP